MKSLKQNKEFFVLAILALVFFFIYSYLPISQLKWQHDNQVSGISLKFNTPDEVINYYFTRQYAQTGELYYFEPLDGFMNRVIFPRWALVVAGKITPGNFLGLDLIYGTLAKIFSSNIIPFLTPLFAVLAVLFFYLLIKMFFEKKVAFVSALLMFIFPGFWYYASRTMFNNVLFLSLLIIGLYFLIKLFHTDEHKYESPDSAQDRHKLTRIHLICLSLLVGLFLGLALITRTSEIGWIFLMILTVLIFYHRNLRFCWPYLLVSLAIFITCFVPVLYHNKILYDNYLSTGYPLNTVSTNLEGGKVGEVSWIQALFLPFGFHPHVIITHVFYNYILKLFWHWLLLWLLGLIIFVSHVFRRNKESEEVRPKGLSYTRAQITINQKLYFVLLLIVNCYLLIYYGSWFFRDALDLNSASIGSSYVRYFLPLFVFNIPLLTFLLGQIGQYLRQKNIIIFTGYWLLVTGYFLFFSGYQVLYQGPESLTVVKNQLIKYQIQAHDILKYVQEDDIILMDVGTDKILFPERKRLIVPQAGVEWPEIQKILPYKKVYYFHHEEKVAKDYLNEIKFNPHGLELEGGVLIEGGGELYKIKYKK